jgi:glutamyl-tRNA synthetase
MSAYVGRYAPSPTGDLHLGNALAAVCAWARARRAGGRVVLRMDDLDRPRAKEGAAARIEDDLATLGLTFDAGPGTDDIGAPYVQSHNEREYFLHAGRLRSLGRLYACRCSRKDIQRAASAPHEGEEGPAYPGTCRELDLPFDDPSLPVAWRFRVPPGVRAIDDALCGRYEQDVATVVGDFVVKRKDGVYGYHLACVVDDNRQGVTEVVRGRDLLASSPRQAQLYDAFELPVPGYAHTPLWIEGDGKRMAKRRGDRTLRALFAQGETGEQVLGRIGRALGVCGAGEAIDAEALAQRLDDETLRPAAVTDAGPVPAQVG